MEYFGRSYYQTCMTTNHPEGSNDYFVDHFADHHPCSNSSDIFTYQCPEGFHCINYDKEKLIRRQNLELNFDRIDTTLILLLFMLSTEDYDPFYYRIVFQNGIIGFVSCAFMLMFGLYVLALMLALIYDTYENEMKMRKVMSKIHYFDGEYEFPFNVQSSELCEYEMLYSNKQYKNIVHRQVSTKPKATLPRSSVIETSFDTMRETMRLLSLFYGVKEAYVLRYPKQLMKSALQLRKVVESKEFIGMINFLIAFQFVILLFYHDKSEFLSAISWLGFNDITTSLRTVFMILFPSAWQETMRQFVDRVKHYFVEEEDLLIYRYTFIETFPYGMFFFIALGHLYSLMFSDLLIPQLFSELNIDVLYGSSAEKKVTISEADRELQITTETPTTYILNVIPFNRKILFYGDSKIRERVKGVWWRKLMLVLLTIETVSTYVDNHWLKEQPEYFNIWLNFRLIVQAIFLFDLLLRLLGDGIYFFMYSRKTSTYAWKSIVVLVDVLTLTCSIFDIILSVSQGPSYRGHQYINIGVSLICLRLVSRTHRLRLWIQTMITNWRGIVNALLFAAFVIALYAITGVQAFGGKMEQCYLRRARAYTWMSYRISLTRPDMNTWEACKQDEDQTSDKFMNKVTYVFNFDNTLDGFQTVLQLIYGDDIWGTIGALTSINTLGEVPKRWANPNAWFFIVAVIFGGFIIDTLIFAVVASNVADKNSIVS
ncbi:hypothetical protein B4U79_17371 [Dinothrombium tinctorium]|uniref:Ion transport domain-containing protein n=1 Tax=Dinothrombium tinctorium TaxID=1965070 RepID=A0A443RDH4_9ACAR|nr:hypothetical protein B4U79_17371 [Dinothrombium tinctorium]